MENTTASMAKRRRLSLFVLFCAIGRANSYKSAARALPVARFIVAFADNEECVRQLDELLVDLSVAIEILKFG